MPFASPLAALFRRSFLPPAVSLSPETRVQVPRTHSMLFTTADLSAGRKRGLALSLSLSLGDSVCACVYVFKKGDAISFISCNSLSRR